MSDNQPELESVCVEKPAANGSHKRTPSASSKVDLLAKAEMERPKRIAIIGAGASGLPSIKSCLEEGLEPVCFERTEEMGGLWNYRDNLGENQATVMRSTVINTSKEIMAYSDFPPAEHYPNFMHNTLVNEYLHEYADNFKLKQYIKFNTEVLEARQAEDFRESGQWILRTSDNKETVFDGLMICTGHHAMPYTAPFPGIEQFQGEVFHSQKYYDSKGFEGKSVLVIGMGNSALDIAVELSRVASKVYMSTRRGSWVWFRVSRNGVPFDMRFLTRTYEFLRQSFPLCTANSYMEHVLNMRMDHEMYGLRPKHRFFEQHPTVNDALANCLAAGLITLRGDVKHFEDSNRVVFEDEQFADVDVVIICTGYTFGYPFLKDKELIPVQSNKVELFKYVFPPQLSQPSLAVIGLIQPIGSIMPISEAQSRWAARVFSSRTKLPSQPAMRKDIDKKRREMSDRFYESQKHTVQVDFIPYMDELASQIGAKPNLFKLLFSDPQLWGACMAGPNVPYIYRIDGPHSWSKARETVLTTKDRMMAPLRREHIPIAGHKTWSYLRAIEFYMMKNAIFVIYVILAALLFVVLCCFVGWTGPWFTFLFTLVFLYFLFFITAMFNFQFDFSTIY